eukprot:TRINITY_DN14549_c0_g1_i2.p1 TRINITY_DN14549_c0_g1~~TRINITY_DN14549_c0_g1_i2.p1  ORF type:complete len:119 (+),score=22.66 TRINITY_DN14549_c0_g1_i2:1010-1366(+)
MKGGKICEWRKEAEVVRLGRDNNNNSGWLVLDIQECLDALDLALNGVGPASGMSKTCDIYNFWNLSLAWREIKRKRGKEKREKRELESAISCFTPKVGPTRCSFSLIFYPLQFSNFSS